VNDRRAELPGQRARRAGRRRRRRRRRLLPLAGAAAILVVVAIVVARSGSGGGSGTSAAVDPTVRTTLVAHLAKPLPAPVWGESAVGLPGGPLIIGGLDSSEASVGGVFQLDPGSGRLSPAGSLEGPLHDAAAAALGERVLVFGGGTEASSDVVQALPASGGTVAAAATAAEVGRLPTVRSDLSAAAIGDRIYVLGGYDGTAPLDSVLATADGTSFEQVAALPQPARYVALAALGGSLYAFGGETAGGGSSDAIRTVDPKAGTARVVGHLPRPLSHASAVALGGRIYVLGGETGGVASDRVWSFDPASGKASAAGRLPIAVSGGAAATVGSTGYLIGGKGGGGEALDSVVLLRLKKVTVAPAAAADSTAAKASHDGPPPPFEGKLLIADRGNNRLLVVNAQKKILWRYPSHAHPAPPGGFYFPDDAFFTHHGTQLISNEEQDERIVRLSFPGGKVLWSYGHAGVAGSEPGYLHEPDDAYLWRDGTISVADAQNCRVLLISPQKKVLREFGEPASCEHEPPRRLGSPNGDTPLPDGNLLISEVNGSYIDEITRTGKLVWSVQLPIEYPSDPQQLGPNRYLVADYTTPGGIYEFDRRGRILWSYHPSSGPGMLDHPSLAERLPGGLIAVNDDYRHRLAIVDRHTRRVVWQYGHSDEPGRAHDYLNTPDGFDLLAPNGETPTHPFTG
jgi:outer membrane protein assembly factor BamB